MGIFFPAAVEFSVDSKEFVAIERRDQSLKRTMASIPETEVDKARVNSKIQHFETLSAYSRTPGNVLSPTETSGGSYARTPNFAEQIKENAPSELIGSYIDLSDQKKQPSRPVASRSDINEAQVRKYLEQLDTTPLVDRLYSEPPISRSNSNSSHNSGQRSTLDTNNLYFTEVELESKATVKLLIPPEVEKPKVGSNRFQCEKRNNLFLSTGMRDWNSEFVCLAKRVNLETNKTYQRLLAWTTILLGME